MGSVVKNERTDKYQISLPAHDHYRLRNQIPSSEVWNKKNIKPATQIITENNKYLMLDNTLMGHKKIKGVYMHVSWLIC